MSRPPVKTCPQCGTTYEQDVKFCPRDGSALRAHREDGSLVGEVLAGRYEVLQRLGAGAMGEVYLAEHVKMGRPCAIKVMNRLLTSDPEAIARFNREAANASRINHSNVAAIYDFGETSDGLIFLAMEYIDGEPLSALLDREGPLPPGRASGIARQIADALVVAHDLGIVHRDLKPDNIMVTRNRDGRDMVKVVDFGIAKASLGVGGQEVTRTGFVVGTPEYMSPEQFVGISVDARADIYAVGCILYKMLTGQLPYPGRAAEGRLRSPVGELPPRPSDVNVSVPKTLDTLVMTTLAFDPDERFANAVELRDALALEQDSPSQTRRAIRIVRVSRRVWFAAGAVAGVALLIALGLSARNSSTQLPASDLAPTADSAVTVPGSAAASSPEPASPTTASAPADSAAARVAPSTAAATPPVPPTRQPARARARDTTGASEMLRRLARAQGSAFEARTRAEVARATPAELAAGTAFREQAERHITDGRLASAIAALDDARRSWESAARIARARGDSLAAARAAAAAPALTQPVESPRVTSGPPLPSTPTVTAPADPLPEVRAAILRYARALEARSIAAMRRSYPNLTAAEEQGWRAVFDGTNRVAATLGVARVISSDTDSAVVQVDAAYAFDFRPGNSGDRAPRATYRMTLRRIGGEWQIVSIR